MTNQIEEIKKLYAQPKTYKIPKKVKAGETQLSFEFTPISLDDMSCLNMSDKMPMAEVAKNAKTLFARSLKISEEDAGKISFAYMEDMLEAVMDCNNFGEEDLKKTGIKKFIKDKQAQTEAKKLEEGKVENAQPDPAA